MPLFGCKSWLCVPWPRMGASRLSSLPSRVAVGVYRAKARMRAAGATKREARRVVCPCLSKLRICSARGERNGGGATRAAGALLRCQGSARWRVLGVCLVRLAAMCKSAQRGAGQRNHRFVVRASRMRSPRARVGRSGCQAVVLDHHCMRRRRLAHGQPSSLATAGQEQYGAAMGQRRCWRSKPCLCTVTRAAWLTADCLGPVHSLPRLSTACWPSA